MVLHQDFREFLKLLNDNKVEYIVVGSFALGLYGNPRNTGDIDIWIRPEKKNAQRMITVLKEFGFESFGYKEEEFLDKNTVIQLGVSPVRIDLLMSISGVEFEDAYKNRTEAVNDKLVIHYLSKEDFIKNKKASGRLKDMADIESITQKNEK